MNYPHYSVSLVWASEFTGKCLKTDLRPPFGLTSSPSSAVLIPKTDSCLMPSVLMIKVSEEVAPSTALQNRA
ncbi:hypothetical protein, partial [Hydrococcus rivularis]|uniref:hypothetical protein n=1 Tax=Hydrococcus rivularis TaxID=1616834 RepID=UPI001C312FC7